MCHSDARIGDSEKGLSATLLHVPSSVRDTSLLPFYHVCITAEERPAVPKIKRICSNHLWQLQLRDAYCCCRSTSDQGVKTCALLAVLRTGRSVFRRTYILIQTKNSFMFSKSAQTITFQCLEEILSEKWCAQDYKKRHGSCHLASRHVSWRRVFGAYRVYALYSAQTSRLLSTVPAIM